MTTLMASQKTDVRAIHVSAPNPDLLPANAKSHALPQRPELCEGIDAYSAWLDAICAHVRHMAQLAATAYHREQVAHHRERLGELERAA